MVEQQRIRFRHSSAMALLELRISSTKSGPVLSGAGKIWPSRFPHQFGQETEQDSWSESSRSV